MDDLGFAIEKDAATLKNKLINSETGLIEKINIVRKDLEEYGIIEMILHEQLAAIECLTQHNMSVMLAHALIKLAQLDEDLVKPIDIESEFESFIEAVRKAQESRN